MSKKTGNFEELLNGSNYPNLILLSLIFAAFFVRIAALLSLRGTVYYNYLLYDEHIFHAWAEKVANGTFKLTSVYEFAPLYPYIMAFVYKLFSVNILYIRILNILFGVAGCYLTYLIGKGVAGKRVGLLSCFVAVFYEPFVFYSIVPLKGAFSVFLFASMLCLFLLSLKKNSVLCVMSVGFVIGLMMNVRPQTLVLIPLIPCFMVFKKIKAKKPLSALILTMVLYFTGLVLAISPFGIVNYMVDGKFDLTTSQSGFNFYRANKLGPPVPVNFAVTDPSKQETQFRIEASRRSNKKLSQKEASDYWKSETFHIFKTHPFVTMKNLCKKTVIFFQRHQMTDHYHIGFVSRFMNILNFPFFTFTIIMPLGMAGLLLLVFRFPNVAELATIFAVYGSTMVIFFTRTRYRLPLMTILIPMAVMGLCQFVSAIKENRRKDCAVYIVSLLLFVIIGWFPVHRTNDLTAYFNGHALALSSQGKKEEAVSYWKQSSDMKGMYSDFANLSLAGHFMSHRKYEESKKYLDLISETSYAVAQKYLLYGEMSLLQGRLKQAASAYEKSLFFNSGQLFPQKRLFSIYSKIDNRKAIEAYNQLKYIHSFYKEKNL